MSVAAADDASTGRTYVNFLGDAGSRALVVRRGDLRRLVALKNEFDPTQRVPAQPEHRACVSDSRSPVSRR